MIDETFVAAYDGKDRSVVDFVIGRAKKAGARVFVAHVLEWSPYTFLTPTELAARHAHRQQELERAQSAVLEPILQHVRAAGVKADGAIRHGNIVDTICAMASEENAALIFCGRSDKFSTRVFGSVASGLAQSAPVPVVVIP